MARGHFLGRLDHENLSKVQRRIAERDLKPGTWGLSYIEDYQKGREPETRAYGYLNALGYAYGYAMAEAFMEGFLSAKDPDEAQEAAYEAIRNIDPWINDILENSDLNIHLAREAVRHAGHLLPAGDDPKEMIRIGQDYRKGMYIRDLTWSVVEALQTAVRSLENFLAWHKTPYGVSYDPEENEYIPEFLLDPSRDEMKRAIREANEEIRKRTYYGQRMEKLPDHPNFTILGWANGSESWYIMHGTLGPAVREVMLRFRQPILLDANQILVEAHPYVMKKILDELEPLPLYEYSLEAKLRGKYPHADDRTVRKVLRALIDAQFPDEDSEERALMAIDTWEIFKKAKVGDPYAQGVMKQFLLSLESPLLPYMKILEDWLDAS